MTDSTTQAWMSPFNSRTKRMLTVHSFDAAASAAGRGRGLTGGYLLYMKGAVVFKNLCKVLMRCARLNPVEARRKRGGEREDGWLCVRVCALAALLLPPCSLHGYPPPCIALFWGGGRTDALVLTPCPSLFQTRARRPRDRPGAVQRRPHQGPAPPAQRHLPTGLRGRV